MAWYEVKYACGHAGRVQLYGKESARQWRLSKMEEEDCPECRRKAQEEENRKIAEQNAADGLPSLSGSEKQVLWAESIRHKVLEQIEERIALSERLRDQKEAKGKAEKAERADQMIGAAKRAYFEIQQETSASWWIDHQGTNHFEQLTLRYFENPDESFPEILEPEVVKHDGIVSVTVTSDIKASYDRNDEFRSLVKHLGYSWNGETWSHALTVGAASLNDLAADTTNRLISAGFRVKVPADVAEMVKTDHFVPFNERRVILHESKYWFCFEENGDLLKVARTLPRSNTWEKDGFYWASISTSYADVALEFAETYGFAIGSQAKAKMEEVQQAHREKVTPKKVTDPIPANAIYQHDDREVIPDLVDED